MLHTPQCHNHHGDAIILTCTGRIHTFEENPMNQKVNTKHFMQELRENY